MDHKRFTVIICTYNSGDRLRKTLDSVINQNNIHKHVGKIIVVDNNSSDNTADIIKEYSSKNELVKYSFEQKQGLSNARLNGVNSADTEWIVFIDDDNILELNWIESAYKYIGDNKGVGAFNGEVIPLVEENISEEERRRLKDVLQGLACTNISREKIDFNRKAHPYRHPFGAGLVIRTAPLKELAKNGWMNTTGRKGEKLSGGEDTEMCRFVKDKGYSYGFNPYMIMQHIIPQFRLEESYLIKLWIGHANGVYDIINNESLYLPKRLAYAALLQVRKVRDLSNKYILKDNSYKIELNTVYRKQFNERLLKDKIIFK